MSWKDDLNNLRKSCVQAFGVPVDYTPIGLSVITIDAIFDRSYIEIDPETQAVISSYTPMLFIDLGDLPSEPKNGDRVLIEGDNYRVESSEPDGKGGSRLPLRKV